MHRLITFSLLVFFGFVSLTPATVRASEISEICTANTRNELLKSVLTGVPQSVLTQGTTEEIVQAAKLNDTAPWILQYGNLLTQTRAGYGVQKKIAESIIATRFKDLELTKVIDEAASKPAHYSPEGLNEAKQILKTYRYRDANVGLNVILGGLGAPIVCAHYGDPLCIPALDRILIHMNPRITEGSLGAFVSLPSVVKQLETDETLVQGAAIFAKKVMGWMSEENPNLNGIHLFSELESSYESAGFTPAEAEDKTWTLIAYYGTRGASLSLLKMLITRETLPLHMSLFLFSAALGTLDHLTVQSGHPFSYPEQIQTECYNGRPYHFWLSAYLSHYLNQLGYPKDSALTATHLSAKLYEFDARTIDRDPTRIYHSKPKSEPVYSAEKNIAFNDAGAAWGIEARAPGASPSRLLNVDESFETIIAHSRELPEFTKTQWKHINGSRLYRYPYFEKLIAPDAAVDRK